MERLNKALARAGISSRRGSEKLIFQKRVSVNGILVERPHLQIDWEKDRIRVDGNLVMPKEKKFYFLLNKPVGYVCSNRRLKREKIFLDLFPTISERLFSVGRLDKMTSGLLLVTNDGLFANKVIHPSSGWTKEYLAKVNEPIESRHLIMLANGTNLEKKWVRPVKVQRVRKQTLKISVKEGKKHEVRLLIKNANLHLLELKRIRIGPLLLGDLPLGSYRKLSKKEQFSLSQNKSYSI